MIIIITPFDTLFFRDGRPFTMGDDTWAEGVFPPSSSTLYGTMRTSYIAYKGDLRRFKNRAMKSTIGTPEDYGSFSIKGVYIRCGNDIFFPLPRDLVRAKNPQTVEDKKKVFKMKTEPAQGLFITNSVIPQLLFSDASETIETVDDGFIDGESLVDYLNATNNNFSYKQKSEFVHIEPKLGIKRSAHTHTTEEGHLYRVGMNRLAFIHPDRTIQDVSILVDYTGLDDFPDNGMLRPGGEAKSAVIKKVDDFRKPELTQETKNKIYKDKRFKLYFATPGVFKNGWLPEKMNESTLIWEKGESKLKLLSAALGKPIMVGGWNMVNNRPKPMRQAIPAGSVYYFEMLKSNIEAIINTFHYQNISDFNSQEGFGLSFVGAIS